MKFARIFLAIFLVLFNLKKSSSIFDINTNTFWSLLNFKFNYVRQTPAHGTLSLFTGTPVERPSYLKEYDFIIVGSGPAGSVLANRLTENPNWKVLLIEAGKVEGILNQVPLMTAALQLTSYTWSYRTEPQKHACFGMANQSCVFNLGRGLGGSSLLYYMIYNRGNRHDYDNFAAIGNEGWSWNEVLPYFKKSEHSVLENLENSPNHGKDGPANIEYIRYRSKLAELFLEANKQLGQEEVDYNSGDQLGVSYLQANTIRGHRQSSFRAFLEPILHRSNLHIMVKTRATKILIDPETKTAYGVEYVRKKKTYTVRAKKEVISSAGVFNSPQLLMLSGVGPEKELKRINVPLIKDLPVGQFFKEHVGIIGITFITNTTVHSPKLSNLLSLPEMGRFLNGRGQFVIPGGVEALSFIKTKEGRGPTVPDVELIFSPTSIQNDGGLTRTGGGLVDEIYDAVYKPLENNNEDSFMIMPFQFHPKSSGKIQLKDNNPFHWPRIQPNFFENPEDVETILDGIKFIMRLINTPAFQSIGARLHDIPLPNCAHNHFASDNYWRCYIRTMCLTLDHQAGGSKMGLESDPTTIVSPELKVHGIKNLRVADVGILPDILTAHTHASSMMIGEKASDMIKQEWNGF